MEGSESSRGQSSFSTQSNALLRKNLAFQKRNMKTNLCLISFPILLCVLLVIIQKLVDSELNKPSNTCGCQCIDSNGDGKCEEKVCGIQYSTIDQVFTCAIPRPPEWPPLLQVPNPDFRAVSTGPGGFAGLPEESCRRTNTCPATVLFTGGNQAFARDVVQNFFPKSSSLNSSTILNSNNGNVLSALSRFALGTDTQTDNIAFIEPAFSSDRPIYNIQSACNASSKLQFGIPVIEGLPVTENDAQCVQSLNIWRDNSSVVNDALFKGYRKANRDGSLNEYMAAYDFQNSSTRNFNVDVWYNSTYKNDTLFGGPPALLRVVRSVNVISNAYLQLLKGSTVKMLFEFTKEMPKPATKLSLDFSSLLGPLFFTWIIELVFPVLLTYLVYEKQYNLRIMMKMHGLGDGPYWIISYGYFLLISVVYVLLLVVFGSLVGLKYFTSNDRGIQFVFFFAFINLQIALAFLMATAFSKVKTAQAIAYIYIFGSGLLAANLLQSFIEDETFPRQWIVVLELIPAFSLFRGLYEFGQYSFIGQYMGTSGMRWKDLKDGQNGMRDVLIIIAVEWCVLLPLAYYLDQLSSQGSRIRKNPFGFLKRFQKKTSFRRQSFGKVGSNVSVQVDRPDVVQEREVVEQLLREPSTDYAVISDNLKKVYPGRDGNPDKLAVEGLSLALPRGECFGFLGPNGAGKTTFINMMIGLTSRTSGNAYVEGYSIQTDMGKIYTSMGVCPQQDMLWQTLTAREHLLFYGRLKNLKGRALLQAVEESLRSVNLFNGGVADKQARKYSGGMKRRLSVAISLIGDPKVVYMDEPSTGLDPASRNNLWNVVKNAKRNRAIILTTHSMEEAEFLCDRLGIFVNGSMQCIGDPKQLKARYGGSYILTMTTSPNEEQEVESLVRRLSPNANKIYHISGTQKFEIPKEGIRIAGVFEAVENAKRRFPIQAWGIADTTLEDVFIKVAKGSDSFNT